MKIYWRSNIVHNDINNSEPEVDPVRLSLTLRLPVEIETKTYPEAKLSMFVLLCNIYIFINIFNFLIEYV